MSTLYDKIGGFATIPNTVMNMIAVIGAKPFTLWSYLRFKTNSESGVAFPSYKTIKKDTGISYRDIARCLRVLESFNLVIRNKRFGNSSEYTLICPSPTPIDSKVLHPLEGKSSQWVQTIKTNSTKTNSTKIPLPLEKITDEWETATQDEKVEPSRKPTKEEYLASIANSASQFDGKHKGIADPKEQRKDDTILTAEWFAVVLDHGEPTPSDKSAAKKIVQNISVERIVEFCQTKKTGSYKRGESEPDAHWIVKDIENWAARGYPPLTKPQEFSAWKVG